MDHPLVIIFFGLPCSGKSYFAEKLAKSLAAEYVNSDHLRRELFPKRTYSDKEKALVYSEILQRMNEAILQKKSLVLDATFYKQESRDLFKKNAPGEIRFFEVWADEQIIKECLKKSRPYSEADFTVYKLIEKNWKPAKEAHLRLESTNDNIDSMLKNANAFLNK